jgi:hypothetical protein
VLPINPDYTASPYNNRFNTDSAWPSRPLLGWVNAVGLTAKVAPEPPSARPFQAGQKGATASRVNRALYGRRYSPSTSWTLSKDIVDTRN